MLAVILQNIPRTLMPIVQKAGDFDLEYILQQSENKFFDDYTPKKIRSRMYEIIRISTDGLSIKLIDKNQRDLLSIIQGNFKTHNNIEYFEIVGTYSKLERNGFLTYLFEILVYEFDYKILSDCQHSSPGSKEFWQAHIKKNKFSIYRLDLKKKNKRKAKYYKDNEIWADAPKNNGNALLINFDYYSPDDVDDSDSENSDYLNNDSQVDEILNLNNLLDDELGIEMENADLSFENIRLIAQKYVDD